MEVLQKFGRMPAGLTIPAIAILLVVVGIPTIQLFLTSLNAPSFSLVNYQAFFEQRADVVILFRTVTMSVVVTAICVIIGYPTAYLIVAAPQRLRITLVVLVLIPWLTSGLVRTYAWTVILGDHGLINNLLIYLGVISSPLTLVYNRLGVYIGMVHIMLPMMILPLLSAMQGIDKSLMAAARSMGARPFAAFWRVFFPLSLPGVRSGALLVFVGCLGFYITPQALGGLSDAMLSGFIADQFQSTFDLAPIATSAYILLAIAMVVLSVFGFNLSDVQGRPAQISHRARLSQFSSLGQGSRYINEIVTHYRAKRWASHLYQVAHGGTWSKLVGVVFMLSVLVYLLCPGLIVIIMSFSGAAFLEFPPSSLSLRWYQSFLGDPSWTGALWTSVQLGIATTIASTIVGTLAAYGLSRTSSRLRSFLIMVILTPITIPVIVVGVAAYLGLVNLGLLGSKTGIVLAHSIGAIASVVVIVSATLANFDRTLEQAAQSMRAGPLRTFTRVTLPLIRPGIIGGAVFAFMHSFDEVVVTSLVSAFAVTTLPLKLLENIKQQIDPTIAAVGSLLTLMPLLWLVALYFVWRRSRLNASHMLTEPAT
ncbi:ABC transporter permease subunit [Bradyrhizobium sp. 190]|uniref:ABC transporter permease subunit n=1 Tax=Bradyrhizobium sp. 190 TaxID=2782658 RepID=UPI001FF7FB6E|nr:ABC transporter permease subunit [Bradyrhizobium sp. 190]MCK1517517.1 ABC transporter permease subunit [Bradyrhizobium sp. 190]